MSNLRDSLMKPEDIHDCFNTQTDIIARLESTTKKMTELNALSEQKFKRVQKSFVNAASMLQKMQGDLGFIHGAIKKLTHLSSLDKSAVDTTTAIVESKTGDVPAHVDNQPKEEIVSNNEEQKTENVIVENKAPEVEQKEEVKLEEKVEEALPAATTAENVLVENEAPEVEVEAKEEVKQEEVKPEDVAPENNTENVEVENKAPEVEVKQEEAKAEEKSEDVAPVETAENNTETTETTEATEDKEEPEEQGDAPAKKKKNKKNKKGNK